MRYALSSVLIALVLLQSVRVMAAGGLVLRNDVCVLTIGFYDAHFTAYQPDARGNEEFCEHLPGAGKTIFVIDYLHRSLKEVPVDFRVIRDVTGKGPFVRVEDIAAIGDLDAHTVYYQEPVIRTDGTLMVEHDFAAKGEYVGVVTAGHPTNDSTYIAAFPLSLGASRFPWAYVAFAGVLLLAAMFLFLMKRIGRSDRAGSA